MFSCKTKLQFFSSIDGLYVDGTFKSAPKFFHQLFTIHGLTTCNLHFSYWPINIQLSMRMYSDIRCQRLKNLLWIFFKRVFMLTPKPPFTPQWQQSGQAVQLKHFVCFHLGQSWWRKIQSLRLSKHYGKKDSEVSQFLKKIFGLSLLQTEEVCGCFTLEFLSNLPNDKRVEEFCNYLLENYIDADSTFPPPVWSECTASSLRTVNACESFPAHFKAMF